MRSRIALSVAACVALLGAAGAEGAQQVYAPGFVPKDAAAARHLRLERRAVDLINRADRRVRAQRPSCRPSTTVPGPRTTTDAPAPAVLNLLAPLRRPATPQDPLPAGSPFLGDFGEVYVNYVRLATAASGQRFTIVVAREDRSRFARSASCLASQRTQLLRLLRGAPRTLRSATLRIAGQLRAQEAKAPKGLQDGVFLFTRNADGKSGGGGGGGSAEYFATHGNFTSSGGGSGSTLDGVLPDGVASLTLEYPKVVSRGPYFKPTRYAHAYVRTVRVQENVVSLRVPRGAGEAFPARMVWRDAGGHVLRVVAGPK